MSIRMIALDMDGTTLSPDGTISEATADAIEEAASRGVQVVISTGRAASTLPECVKNLHGIRYAITSNGARVIDLSTGEYLYGQYLSRSAINRSIEIAEKNHITIEAFYDGKAYIDKELYDDIYENGCGYRNRDYVLRTRIPKDDIFTCMRDNIDIIENINFFFPTPEILEGYRDVIEAIPEATITMSFPVNLEVGGPNTSKKSALIILMDKLGIDRQELMCAGDAPNDIQMIEYAGIGVAMGNAWGNTKEHADYVTASNADDGVAKAIHKFVLDV